MPAAHDSIAQDLILFPPALRGVFEQDGVQAHLLGVLDIRQQVIYKDGLLRAQIERGEQSNTTPPRSKITFRSAPAMGYSSSSPMGIPGGASIGFAATNFAGSS